MEEIVRVLIDFIVYAIMGIAASLFFFHYKERDLLGGFWGGAVIGMIGAVIIGILAGFESWFIRVFTWLMQPKFKDVLIFRVNLITAFVGAFLFVYILNRINHDKKRK